MSTLKQRIRLQQARTQFDRGLITEEQFAAIEIECTADIIVGQTEEFTGDPNAGTQLKSETVLKPARSGVPVVKAVKPVKPIVPKAPRAPRARANTAAAGSASTPAVPATGDNLGNV